MLKNPESIVTHLRTLQRKIRDAVVAGRRAVDLHKVSHQSSADTIYKLDLLIEPVIEAYCEAWGKERPLVLVAEGIEPETGRVFPAGADETDAEIRLIMDPVDGTRGLMYDKRAAWSLAGAAPNKGLKTRLADIEVSVMTELPTSKMGQADVFWAIKGRGAKGVRENIAAGRSSRKAIDLVLAPSRAKTLAHGFASVANFFPGTKVLAGELMEFLALKLIGKKAIYDASIFDDQYISTGGQFYELIVGHDRFCADLRPMFYAVQDRKDGLCCHPYDCAGLLIAQEAGVIMTDGLGENLDAPMDVTTSVSWVGFANKTIRRKVQPLIVEFLKERQKRGRR
jgi:fructose-1,6-bisphosphatase/inositol monophosphatase family enzyme